MKNKKDAAVSSKLRYTKKSTLAVYLTLRGLVILAAVLSALRGDFQSLFLCVLSLILMILPSVFEHKFAVELPATLEIIILLFIFAAEILGEINSFYVRVPHWDTILHTMNGFLCAAIGFSLVDLLNRTDRFSLKLSSVYLAAVAFCFSMTVGVMWEFFEYGADVLLGLDMQKDTVVDFVNSVALDETRTNTVISLGGIKDVTVIYEDGTSASLGVGGYLDIGLHDTMKDLIVNFIGAVIFSVIGYFYVKARGKGSFAARFIPQVKNIEQASENPEDHDVM